MFLKKDDYFPLIHTIADGLEINKLDDDIYWLISVELQKRIREILIKAKNFMILKRSNEMTFDDVNSALKLLGYHQLLGYLLNPTYKFIPVSGPIKSWIIQSKNQDLLDYSTDQLKCSIPKVCLHSYWLALEGEQPKIPENIILEDENPQVNLLTIKKQTSIKSNYTKRNEVSQELFGFYRQLDFSIKDEIASLRNISIISSFAISKNLKELLNSVKSQPCIKPLVPKIILYLNDLYKSDDSPYACYCILLVINVLVFNRLISIEEHLHIILSMTTSFLIKPIDIEKGCIIIKALSSEILIELTQRFSKKYPKMITELVQVFESLLLIDKPSLTSLLGTILGLKCIGSKIIQQYICKELKLILSKIAKGQNHKEKIECMGVLLETISFCLRELLPQDALLESVNVYEMIEEELGEQLLFYDIGYRVQQYELNI